MFQGLRKASASGGRAAIVWRGKQAALARASHRDDERPHLAVVLHNFRRDDDYSAPLGGFRLGNSTLGQSQISTILPEGSYQLLLEELPNAPREEMREALGWRIRERLDTRLEDTVIELLEMPAQARGSGNPSAYAVVARRDDVKSQIARVRAVGLQLDAIDLPELCLRNIAVRLPQDADGVAFLHFTEDSGVLTVTRQGILYLIRRIEIGASQFGPDADPAVQESLVSAVCLELQRSLDYYETHYDLPSISSLVLGPGTGMSSLGSAIGEQLGLGVQTLDLSDLFEMAEPLDVDTQNKCLYAVGAALRPRVAEGWD